MAMKGVLRPGHVSIRLLDLEEGLGRYRDRLGLEVVDKDDQGRIYLKGWDEQDWFSVILREAEEPDMASPVAVPFIFSIHPEIVMKSSMGITPGIPTMSQ